ncbi:hypothetical protein [Paenibacillus arenilitoris]|uniref:Uncharacterized protein n=1 Tax=Paenibacillus arenilitoris TaxID=2772299 RepID=A0A927CQQ6_9BACL|nr:hypothetical protein [Paenibacillus arenilitoris]MBD2871357.1 hypothetical protein [Paenibacillus arenilitoris]
MRDTTITAVSPEKVEMLRRLEPYAYQVAYFMLQDGRLAEEAAKAALLEIGSLGGLADEPAEALRGRTKKAAIKVSLAAAAAALSREA